MSNWVQCEKCGEEYEFDAGHSLARCAASRAASNEEETEDLQDALSALTDLVIALAPQCGECGRPATWRRESAAMAYLYCDDHVPPEDPLDYVYGPSRALPHANALRKVLGI